MANHPNRTKVITYQSPTGCKINLTSRQIKQLEQSGIWPRDHAGHEYCTVSHGLHRGRPVDDVELLAVSQNS